MGKLAFVFPGQGAQYVGMGKEFYEQISVSRKVYTICLLYTSPSPRDTR